jgi:GntR family transcriptional regulator/MocR family aminotransferase
MSRGRPTASVLVRLDPASPQPLHRQIYAGLRGAILSGSLAPGVRVPSSRALATDLDVSRTTVLQAFEQLLTEGYLVSEPASGTRVAEQLPDDLLQVRGARQGRRPVRPAAAALSRRGAALAVIPRGAPRLGPVPRAFRPCIPALDLFPVDLWSRLASRRRRRLSAAQLDYGDPAGFRPLREAIAAHVTAARGVRCTADQVLVMSGTHGTLDLAVRLLLDPGEAAWLEEPGYLAARSALTAGGAAVVPVPVDGEGLDVEAGTALGPEARLVYVCPSHQYPLGVSMSLARRLALLRWAERSSAWILEDDYDSEYRYAGRPIPALQGLDAAGRVLYLGTFSKTLFPSLRLGFLIVPEALVEPFVAVRASTELLPPTLDQAVLADFLGEGHFARHVRRMRGVYEERLAVFLETAERLCGGALRLRPGGTGLHLLGELADGMADRVATEEALARGVELGPLSVYYSGPARRQGLLLGFAAFDPAAIRAAMERLARALEAARRRGAETAARRPA